MSVWFVFNFGHSHFYRHIADSFNLIFLSRFAEQNKRGGTCPQRRCFAACSGFHDIGPAPRNPQFILNLLALVGAGPYIIISEYLVIINCCLREITIH